ncbi:hypothetical protein BC628DRAFT_541372 [Trametes gibbosa]|nr:hypothetical protein BC628DRAFT_541372 [Trametes gibbosa]
MRAGSPDPRSSHLLRCSSPRPRPPLFAVRRSSSYIHSTLRPRIPVSSPLCFPSVPCCEYWSLSAPPTPRALLLNSVPPHPTAVSPPFVSSPSRCIAAGRVLPLLGRGCTTSPSCRSSPITSHPPTYIPSCISHSTSRVPHPHISHPTSRIPACIAIHCAYFVLCSLPFAPPPPPPRLSFYAPPVARISTSCMCVPCNAVMDGTSPLPSLAGVWCGSSCSRSR